MLIKFSSIDFIQGKKLFNLFVFFNQNDQKYKISPNSACLMEIGVKHSFELIDFHLNRIFVWINVSSKKQLKYDLDLAFDFVLL